MHVGLIGMSLAWPFSLVIACKLWPQLEVVISTRPRCGWPWPATYECEMMRLCASLLRMNAHGIRWLDHLDGLTNKLNVTPVSQFEENGNLLKATGGGAAHSPYSCTLALITSFQKECCSQHKNNRCGPVRCADVGGGCWSDMRGKYYWLAGGWRLLLEWCERKTLLAG